MGHSLCSFILRQIPRRSPTHNTVYFTTTRLGGYNNIHPPQKNFIVAKTRFSGSSEAAFCLLWGGGIFSC